MKKSIFFFFLISYNVYSQDTHFSQFNISNSMYNPSLIGHQKLDYKIGFQHRSQWAEVSVPFKTTITFFEMKEVIKNQSLGVSFLYDISGDSKLSSTGIVLGTSRSYVLKKNKIRIGLQLGAYQKKTDFSSLLFPQQQVSINSPSFWFFDFSFGGIYFKKINQKTNIQIGGALFHINRPNQTYLNNNLKLPIKYSVHTELKHIINKKYTLSPKIYYTIQDEAKEIVTGGELNYIFKKNKNQNLKFKTNLYYRVRDAIIFGVGLEIETLTVIFNYDINTSSLAKASHYKGSGEITLIYLWNKQTKTINEKCPKYL